VEKCSPVTAPRSGHGVKVAPLVLKSSVRPCRGQARHAATTLAAHAEKAGVEALTLTPTAGDFNEDLRLVGYVA
jgi:hypothetical protein